MQKRNPSVLVYLKHLSKQDLFKLAKKKKAKIPKYWTKTKIVETLSTIVKKSDMPKLTSQKLKNKTATKPDKKPVKRIRLEDRVLKIFQRKGYQCSKKYQINSIKIDVVGCKKGSLFTSDKYAIVECKDKTKVVSADFKKLLGNLILYIKKNNLNTDCVKGYLYTTGLFDREVRSQARKLPIIQLKRLKRR